MKKYRKYLFAFIVLAGVLMLITLCAGCMADKIIFQPRPDLYPKLEGVEMLALKNSGNIALKYTPPAQEEGLIFLHCHGNAENLRTIQWRQELFALKGYGFCAFDYEGYGRSSGKPSEAGVRRDVLRVWRYLTEEKKIPPERIVIHGFSLGTGAAVFLASQITNAKALILEAPFTSTYGVVGLAWVPGNRFVSIDRIPQVKMPVMIMHGDRDRIIPFRHGKKLFAKAPDPKRFFHIRGAGHNNIIATAGDTYWQQINEFLQIKK
ncbi:MAG: alpha/beta hydrolase [Lentisphaerae bacterium]|nr:alpha/beta hydrolase [Lentisphaerota bacterium]